MMASAGTCRVKWSIMDTVGNIDTPYILYTLTLIKCCHLSYFIEVPDTCLEQGDDRSFNKLTVRERINKIASISYDVSEFLECTQMLLT